jgi:hypothetical protein
VLKCWIIIEEARPLGAGNIPTTVAACCLADNKAMASSFAVFKNWFAQYSDIRLLFFRQQVLSARQHIFLCWPAKNFRTGRY